MADCGDAAKAVFQRLRRHCPELGLCVSVPREDAPRRHDHRPLDRM